MVKPLSFKGDKKAKKRKVGRAPYDAEARPAKALVASDAAAEGVDDDDGWVTAEAAGDLAGPVMVVLPSAPATCLACDAAGTVFASVVENMAEADPATAEPHDVRQVWVASRVAGTDGVSLKGHHGRYGRGTSGRGRRG